MLMFLYTNRYISILYYIVHMELVCIWLKKEAKKLVSSTQTETWSEAETSFNNFAPLYRHLKINLLKM